LPPHVLAEVKRFFLDYKVLEEKEVAIEELRGHKDAERVIMDAVWLYSEQKEKLR
jgi:inorganic pyrophosphatase